jgi:hypothetical protein
MPYPENTPTPDDLPGLSPQEIAGLPVELLAILQREIDERLKRDKAAKTRLDAALTVRYATRAAEERQAQAKDTGTVRFDDGDFTVVADLPKRVEWDQPSWPPWSSGSAPPGTTRPNMSTSPSRCPSANTRPGPMRSARASSQRGR